MGEQPQKLTDNWEPYIGGYKKQPYALRLKDGGEIPWAWPNAGTFTPDMSHRCIEQSEVTHVKRIANGYAYWEYE